MHPFEKTILHLIQTQHERTQDPVDAALLAEVEAAISARHIDLPEPAAQPPNPQAAD